MAEKLEHSLAIRSRFLANMSHEVRTPLSGIIGMSRILMESGISLPPPLPPLPPFPLLPFSSPFLSSQNMQYKNLR